MPTEVKTCLRKKRIPYFIKQYIDLIHPVAETYAYNLLKNHFHMMIKVRSEEEIIDFVRLNRPGRFKDLQGFKNLEGLTLKQQFSNFLNAYAKAFNKAYCRTGSLFQANLKKKKVESDAYFTQLILYIHQNPVKHGFVESLYDWPYSSIHEYLNDEDCNRFKFPNSPKLIGSAAKATVIEWFGGLAAFKNAHEDIGELRSVFD